MSFFAEVIDATTQSSAIAGAQINIRHGLNSTYGAVAYAMQSDHFGRIHLDSIEPGIYTVEVRKAGYLASHRNVALTSVTATQIHTLHLRPVLNLGDIHSAAEMSIILTWDQNPQDLDSHLTGPKANARDLNDRFHIYFGRKCWSDANLHSAGSCAGLWDSATGGERFPNATAYLDRDDVWSYGPETITIHRMIAGEYNYYVHHYSGSGSITSTSAAQVVVIDKYGRNYMFHAPSVGGSGRSGDTWHVFKTDIFGNIIPMNTIINRQSIRSRSPWHNEVESLLDKIPAK